MEKKLAVVLFNLGAPDQLPAVRPFLFNLFHDPAIFALPQPFRWLLAQLVSRRRTPTAQAIYRQMGGGSPLLPLTQAQATALDAQLKTRLPHYRSQSFIAMRYWHPMTQETVRQVKAFAPDEILLLPLYPQFSTTTTGSSYAAWQKEAERQGLTAPTQLICCYPTEPDFIDAHVTLIRQSLKDQPLEKLRILFSAHGLPENRIQQGDPYQWQVEQTVQAVVTRLHLPQLDWTVCYQSKVGPLTWIGPSTDDEIRRAGQEGKNLLVVPIAFVSDHSETLVELDIEYAHLAQAAGVKQYRRVPALGTTPEFITSLAEMLYKRLHQPVPVASHRGERFCSPSWAQCPCRSRNHA